MQKIEAKDKLKLLGITRWQAKFWRSYIWIMQKASMQFNAVSRLQKFMGKEQKEDLFKF